MKNIMIYPIEKNDIFFMKYRELLSKYEKIYFGTKKGFIFTNEDIHDINNDEKVKDINIVTDLERYILKIDVLYINEDSRTSIEELAHIINIALLNNKKVISSKELRSKYNANCVGKNLGDENHIDLHEDKFKIDNNINKIFNFNTPIITVIGTEQYTDKFNVQLHLRKFLQDKGFKISQIGTKKSANIFDIYNIPDCIFSNELSENDKVRYFNQYIKRIEHIDKPDIIVIGIPLGIIKNNDEFHNDFSILPFELLNAFTSDYTIMCMHYGNYDESNLNYFRMIADVRFGVEVDSFVMSNNFYDYSQSIRMQSKQFLRMPTNKTQEKVQEIKSFCDVDLYLNTKHDLSNMCECMLSKFEEYSNIECI